MCEMYSESKKAVQRFGAGKIRSVRNDGFPYGIPHSIICTSSAPVVRPAVTVPGTKL
jgi:hypothetical protein